jgi:hypothetical protein
MKQLLTIGILTAFELLRKYKVVSNMIGNATDRIEMITNRLTDFETRLKVNMEDNEELLTDLNYDFEDTYDDVFLRFDFSELELREQ